MILGWTALQPSARERRWLQAAVAACLLIAAALAFAVGTMDPRHPMRVGIAAIVAFAASLLGIARLRRSPSIVLELAIRDGQVQLRRATVEAAVPGPSARCVFVAPWLITFRFGSTLVRIWPDSLPPEAFRRLHACVRWERPSGADPKQRPGPGPENETDS